MKIDLSRYTDVELILRTGEYIYRGVTYGFDKGRLLQSPPSKFSDDNFLKRKYTGTEKSLLQNFMVESFTVAGVLNYDLQEKLKKTAADILAQDQETDPKKLFIEKAKQIIPSYQYDGSMPPDGHLKTNFRTAVNSAYHGSLWNKIEASGIYVALEYETRGDSKVRPAHRLLNGKIYYKEDPIWKLIYPPNDHNCRCRVIPKTLDEIKGVTVENPVRTEDEEKQLLKDTGVSDEFARNSGMTHSIWNKWLESELKAKDINQIYDRMKGYASENMPAKDSIVKESLKQDSKLFSVSSEVWGREKFNKKADQYESSVTFIKIFQDKFEVIVSVNGVLSEVKIYDLKELDNFRDGILIKIKK